MTEGRRASGRFARAKLRAMARERVRIQRGEYEPRKVERIGVYAGNSEVVVDGQRYPFRDTQNINPMLGDTMTVRNVGRKAVVIMAPIEGTEVT